MFDDTVKIKDLILWTEKEGKLQRVINFIWTHTNMYINLCSFQYHVWLLWLLYFILSAIQRMAQSVMYLTIASFHFWVGLLTHTLSFCVSHWGRSSLCSKSAFYFLSLHQPLRQKLWLRGQAIQSHLIMLRDVARSPAAVVDVKCTCHVQVYQPWGPIWYHCYQGRLWIF